MTLWWTRPAESDLVEILDYIANDDASAAVATLDRIEQCAERLIDFPLSGREGSVQGTRELSIPGLPFLLVYRVEGDAVEVLRVLHGAREWPPRA